MRRRRAIERDAHFVGTIRRPEWLDRISWRWRYQRAAYRVSVAERAIEAGLLPRGPGERYLRDEVLHLARLAEKGKSWDYRVAAWGAQRYEQAGRLGTSRLRPAANAAAAHLVSTVLDPVPWGSSRQDRAKIRASAEIWRSQFDALNHKGEIRPTLDGFSFAELPRSNCYLAAIAGVAALDGHPMKAPWTLTEQGVRLRVPVAKEQERISQITSWAYGSKRSTTFWEMSRHLQELGPNGLIMASWEEGGFVAHVELIKNFDGVAMVLDPYWAVWQVAKQSDFRRGGVNYQVVRSGTPVLHVDEQARTAEVFARLGPEIRAKVCESHPFRHGYSVPASVAAAMRELAHRGLTSMPTLARQLNMARRAARMTVENDVHSTLGEPADRFRDGCRKKHIMTSFWDLGAAPASSSLALARHVLAVGGSGPVLAVDESGNPKALLMLDEHIATVDLRTAALAPGIDLLGRVQTLDVANVLDRDPHQLDVSSASKALIAAKPSAGRDF